MQLIKIFSRISLALIILHASFSLSGCGSLNRKFPNLRIPQYKLTKTGVGAATGTALGGGVGAVIGSASGNVGQGAALGALSGATAGAVIGKQLEKGQQAIALQQRKLDQQSSQIQQLNREIDSLRYESGDRVGSQRGRLGASPVDPIGSGSSSAKIEDLKKSKPSGVGNSSSKANFSSAPVYRANVSSDDLQKFLSRVPVRKPRAEAEPVGLRAKVKTASAVKSSPRVTAVDGRKFVGNKFSRNESSQGQYAKKSFKSEAVIPEKKIQKTPKKQERVLVEQPEVRKLESKSLEKLANKMKKPQKIENVKVDSANDLLESKKSEARKIDLIKIPAVTSGAAKKANETVRTAELNIQPPTIRKVGKSGAVKEQLESKSKAAAVYSSKLASSRAKAQERLDSDKEDKEIVNAAKLAELESKESKSKIPSAAALSLPSSKIKHSSPSCLEAENEAERAREATSDADKLFYYRRALRLCGESSNYHFETAKAYLAIGRREDAAFEFRQAVDLDPNNKAAAQMLKNMGQ